MKYIYFFLLFLSSTIHSATIIYTDSYIDVINNQVKKNFSITIEKDIITSIDKGFINIDDGDTFLDLRGRTLMPGLMDMHVHFGQEYQSKAERPAKIERESSAIMAAKHALITLKAGFTTVRQVGDSGLIAVSYTHLTLPTKA